MPNVIFLVTLVFKGHLIFIQQVFKRVEGKCAARSKPVCEGVGFIFGLLLSRFLKSEWLYGLYGRKKIPTADEIPCYLTWCFLLNGFNAVIQSLTTFLTNHQEFPINLV